MKDMIKILDATINMIQDCALSYTGFVGQAAPAVGNIAKDAAREFASSHLPHKLALVKKELLGFGKRNRKAVASMNKALEEASNMVMESLLSAEAKISDQDSNTEDAA